MRGLIVGFVWPVILGGNSVVWAEGITEYGALIEERSINVTNPRSKEITRPPATEDVELISKRQLKKRATEKPDNNKATGKKTAYVLRAKGKEMLTTAVQHSSIQKPIPVAQQPVIISTSTGSTRQLVSRETNPLRSPSNTRNNLSIKMAGFTKPRAIAEGSAIIRTGLARKGLAPTSAQSTTLTKEPNSRTGETKIPSRGAASKMKPGSATQAKGKKICRRGSNDGDPECRDDIVPHRQSDEGLFMQAPKTVSIAEGDKPRRWSPKGLSLNTQESLDRRKAKEAAINHRWQTGIHAANIAATGTGLSSGFPALCCHGMACGSNIACSTVAGASLVGSGILIAACAGVATCIKFYKDREREKALDNKLDMIYGDTKGLRRKQSEHEKALKKHDGIGNDLKNNQEKLAGDLNQQKTATQDAQNRGIRNTLELMNVKDDVKDAKQTSLKASSSTNELKEQETGRWTNQQETNRLSDLRHRRTEEAIRKLGVNLPEFDPMMYNSPAKK